MSIQNRTDWFEVCRRWGQVNLQEIDPAGTDIEWWAEIFRRTRIDGLTINAGGIYAFYPTALPQFRPQKELNRDLFGEFVSAAKELGLYVLARMDAAGIHPDFMSSHKDWIMVDKQGRPYKYRGDLDLYYACPSGPYYREFIPQVLKEILENYDADGFFDNGWPAQGRREAMCHCTYCKRSFREKTGLSIPDEEDWDDPDFRQWIKWRYSLMEEVWDLFDRTAKGVKPWAIWQGNLHGRDFAGAANRGEDLLTLARRSSMFGSDHQGRELHTPPFSAGEMGKLLRCIAEGKPCYNVIGTWYAHTPAKRTLAKPLAEQALWMAEIVATGVRPWWHAIGASNRDRRWVDGVVDFFEWHAQNQDHLLEGRTSMAKVALVYSVNTLDYYGREHPDSRVSDHWHGMYYALLRNRIPFDIVHERQLDAESLSRYNVLALSNTACLSDEQCEQIRAFVQRGGGIVATFEASLYDQDGQPRADYGLADVLGVHQSGPTTGPVGHAFQLVRSPGHPILDWVHDTDYLAFNGRLCPATADEGVESLLTLIPDFPTRPPETTFPRIRETQTPTLLARDWGTYRSVYFPGDTDRELWENNFPEFHRLLGNAVLWALGDELDVVVQGPGLVDVQPYSKPDHIVVHLVNLNQPNLWKAPIDEIAPLPGLKVSVALPRGRSARGARLLVSGREPDVTVADGRASLNTGQIEAHEVVVLELE